MWHSDVLRPSLCFLGMNGQILESLEELESVGGGDGRKCRRQIESTVLPFGANRVLNML